MSEFNKTDIKLTDETNAQFTEIYKTHYPVIRGVLSSKIDDRVDADDIAQDIFIEYLNEIDNVRKPRSWLYVITKNKIALYYKTIKGMTEDIAQLEATGDSTLAYINGFRDTRLIIQDAIENIEDENDKLIFDLISVQYFEFNEVAEIMGMGLGKIKYRHNQVVLFILDFLRKKGINNIEELL